MFGRSYFISILTCVALVLLTSCSTGKWEGQAVDEQTPQREGLYSTPEGKKTASELLLTANFREQIEYFFINHYGRVPASYEEWRDSGFLTWTFWSGNPTKPVVHLNHSPSVAYDPVGAFHYENLGPMKCKIEHVHEIDGKREVYSVTTDLTEPTIHSFKPELTYVEAKADLFYALTHLLHINYYLCAVPPRSPDENPASLLDISNGYISFVPEGFKVPEGVDLDGFFEFGFDFTTGGIYALTDLQESRYSLMIDSFGEPVENQRAKIEGHSKFVLFSSDLLKQGFTGVFD